MYIIVKHQATGGAIVLPVMFSTLKEGQLYLQNKLPVEQSHGYDGSRIGIHKDCLVVAKKGAGCFECEYILQKLVCEKSIYVEGVPPGAYRGIPKDKRAPSACGL